MLTAGYVGVDVCQKESEPAGVEVNITFSNRFSSLVEYVGGEPNVDVVL